ncbi:SGT1 and CS domain protein [Talaromyces stipitatus ATCC 10500]|uniref:SGT1 and CS domain protein n=1 Tax=Talaromyces stipitatus (strain ATCC 10500 / CBS 375.48 / QM 6759 / NRRL 1006) TaxID=441959 RepID=B8M9Q3_TALSN|nr:SGT1 and CS domain protein [Talaromyces stipitatus ATCC 10500]EED18055.1 SGT1 and CS domain protein [Talaromyces stipitatus ATCC 10500]
MNAATQGDKAASLSDWPSAITHYTNALIELPRAPSYYIKRSTAYSRRKTVDGGPDLQAALRDVELALALARERGKRELIIEAQLRRAIVFFQLERYGDAGFLFDLLEENVGKKDGAGGDKSVQVKAAMSAQKGSQQKLENELSIWRLKIKGKIGKLEGNDEKLAVTVREYPDIKIPSEEELRKRLKDQFSSTNTEVASAANRTTESTLAVSGSTSAAPPFTAGPGAPTTTPAPVSAPAKIRHEWYQSQDSVVVTIYAKNVDKSKLETELQENILSLEFPLPSGSTYSFTLDPLYAPIDTTQSKVNVLSTKIEITLCKRTPGQKWGALECSATAPVLSNPANTVTVNSTAAVPITQTPTQINNNTGGPAYPTSSKHGVKNWDKLADDLTAKKKKKDEKKKSGEAPNGEEDDDDDTASIDSDFGGGDAVDSFFKKLYAGSDPDTRRAMVKSFYESQGTALSTNWDEVGKEKVPVHPPSDN